jgi:hypothetical protein
VRAITERLACGLAAAAPPIGLARLNVDGERYFASDYGFGHVSLALRIIEAAV